MTARPDSIPFVLFGAGGVLGGEALRLLEGHPRLHLAAAATRGGGALDAVQPHVRPAVAAMTVDAACDEVARLAERGRVAVMFALPHGESPALWRSLRERLGANAGAALVVDLAADYRLRDAALRTRTYGAEHADADAIDSFTYGLPEFARDAIRGSTRVAAPGCFATALQLATLPLADAGLVDRARPLLFAGVTGSSGSGAHPAPNTHHPFRNGNLWAYSLAGHRHEAELAQALAQRGVDATVHFVPHSGPFTRGIHLTAFLPLAPDATGDDAAALYAAAYEGAPFVEVLESGTPDLRRVAGSNRAVVAARARGDVLTVVVALDNVVKGGAGQGLQCLNLMLGFDEGLGLPRCGLGVV